VTSGWPLPWLPAIKWIRPRQMTITVVSLVLVIGLAVGIGREFRRAESAEQSLAVFTVQPRDLSVTVTERGTLESQESALVVCEAEDVPGDAVWGTPILWLIKNGTMVEKGDLIVELDAASHVERYDEQLLKTIYARAQAIARKADYDNRITKNQTIRANAELALEVAKLALEQYEDREGGTFQIQFQNVELSIDQNEAQQKIADGDLRAVRTLRGLGYKTDADVAQARLAALRAKNALDRAKAQRRILTVYNYKRQKLRLEGDVESAVRTLSLVEGNNLAALSQNKIWLKMAEMGLNWHEGRLAQFESQVKKCKIYAPQAGMVTYHVETDFWGNSSGIKEGVAVRQRQPLVSIPTLKHMQVKAMVHESVIDRVAVGLRATIRLDVFPDRQYHGTVKSVDVLADPGGWIASDTKVYKTIVAIDGEVEHIKPGMTAVMQIHLDRLDGVLCVPIQSIERDGEENWCYVDKGGRVIRCRVETGEMDDRFIEIRAGLSAGDRVFVDPSPYSEIASPQ
jgi:HlyD family secretion protein